MGVKVGLKRRPRINGCNYLRKLRRIVFFNSRAARLSISIDCVKEAVTLLIK